MNIFYYYETCLFYGNYCLCIVSWLILQYTFAIIIVFDIILLVVCFFLIIYRKTFIISVLTFISVKRTALSMIRLNLPD